MQLAVPANPFYYLRNFQLMLDTLQRRDGDLLAPMELRFIEEFQRLPHPAQALLVRMIMRKGPLFRANRLMYVEIGDPGVAMEPLILLGWVDDRPEPSLAELFRLFRKDEVAIFLQLPPQRAKESKAALLASLQHMLEERQPHERCRGLDRLYRLSIGELTGRLVSMFFGNFRQDLTEFVLADLNIFRYENAWERAPSRPFPSRRHVEDFHRLFQCRRRLHEGEDLAGIEQAMPEAIADCDWLEERRQKLRFQIARAYERAGNTVRAFHLYSTCSYPEARVRLGRLRTAGDGRARGASRSPSCVPIFELSMAAAADRSVEHCVRDHLSAEAGEVTSVHYVENGLINSLFGLLCWPAVFAPIPGAFFHPFHHGPADLSQAGFFPRRQREFDACFAELASGTYKDTILRRFADRFGISSPFVAWDLVDQPLLSMALDCIPAEHLALWFAWMVRDIRTHKAGFPDLVQFWPCSRRYRLVEVKAPGDRLQDNQRACLEYMLSHRMPVSVCRVKWIAPPVARFAMMAAE